MKTRPRGIDRDKPYIDLEKACRIYLEKNPHIKRFNIVDLHKLYIKRNPNNKVSYQTFINYNKRGFNQMHAFTSIAKIVGLDSFDDLITIP